MATDKIRISKSTCDALQPGEDISDSEIRGFRARKLPSGRVRFDYRYRVHGERKVYNIGLMGEITAEDARRQAKIVAGEATKGNDPAAERKAKRDSETNTVDHVLDRFIEEYLKPLDAQRKRKRHRGSSYLKSVTGAFNKWVRPKIGTKSIYAVSRSDINKLLTEVFEAGRKVTSNRTLAFLRKAFNWYAIQDESFNSPIVKGMAKHRAIMRSRILDQGELRYVMAAADALAAEGEVPSCYPKVMRALLYSTQRIGTVGDAHSRDFKGEDWITKVKDSKWPDPDGRDFLIPITTELRLTFGDRKGYVFSTDRGKTPYQDYSGAKEKHDAKIAQLRKADGLKEVMPHWTYHDIRRTGRSTLPQLGVLEDHSEAVLGHLPAPIRRNYNVYQWRDEKRGALERLAEHYNGILKPPPRDAGNVVSLSRRRRAK